MLLGDFENRVSGDWDVKRRGKVEWSLVFGASCEDCGYQCLGGSANSKLFCTIRLLKSSRAERERVMALRNAF